MSKTSRISQALLGMTLAFFVGAAVLSAQTHKPDAGHQAQAQTQAPAKDALKPAVYAPNLPGWIKHLPEDKAEAAKNLWLVDGRAITGYKELITAKRHELDALLTLPGTDDKAVQAVVKEITVNEEKLLNAEITFRRNLEKAGIPAWGVMDHGKHRMMDHGSGMKGMEGGKMGMMGMMQGHGSSNDGSGDAKKDGAAGH